MYLIIYKNGPFQAYFGEDGFLTRYVEKAVRYPSREEATTAAQTKALQSQFEGSRDAWFVFSEDEALVGEIMGA